MCLAISLVFKPGSFGEDLKMSCLPTDSEPAWAEERETRVTMKSGIFTSGGLTPGDRPIDLPARTTYWGLMGSVPNSLVALTRWPSLALGSHPLNVGGLQSMQAGRCWIPECSGTAWG